MIGKIIEGRYAGAGVYRSSEDNLLHIQTEDGLSVALSKENIITMEDVTKQSSGHEKKDIMVIWNDFEASLIRLGAPAPRKEAAAPIMPPVEQQPTPVPRKGKGKIVLLLLAVFFLILAGVGAAMFILSQQPKEKTEVYALVINGTPLEGQLTATFEKGIPNGPGTFAYTDGEITVSYTGQWEYGALSGNGTLCYEGYRLSLGDKVYIGTYSGDALAGIPAGMGTFTSGDSSDLLIYTGSWAEGVPSGQGSIEVEGLSIVYQDVTHTGKYVGDVVDGIPSGTGDFTAAGDKGQLSYSGIWESGKITGPGKMDTDCYTVHFNDGAIRTGTYSGDILAGLAEGEGSFTARNSENSLYTYTGQWKNGLFHGQGVRYFPEEDDYRFEGSFTAGDYTPNVAEFFRFYGTLPEHEYSVSSKAWSTLRAHPNVFLKNDASGTYVSIDNSFSYNAFTKNPSKYGDKLISVSSLRVVQIFEYEEYGYEYSFLILDRPYGDEVYYVRIFGHLDNIYEGDYVTLTALPLDYFTYPNVSGTSIWAIACAGVSIRK